MNSFTALAEPARQHLLAAMRDNPVCVGDLVTSTGMSQPVVSKHLRILRDAGFVSVQPKGQKRIYQLDPIGFAEVEEWLRPYRQLWSDRLDNLENFLNQETVHPGEDR